MRFDLRSPCDNCPFRTDVRPYLTVERVLGIVRDIMHRDLTFACHKTTSAGLGRRQRVRDHQHCAGALILLERAGRPNWRVRFAALLGLFRPGALDLSAPVHTPESLVKSHKNLR